VVDDIRGLLESAREARAAGRSEAALADYRRAAELASAQGLTTERIVALKGMGQVERDLELPEAACARYREAAALCRRVDEPMMLAHTLRHVADLERERGLREAALAAAAEALEIYRRHPEVPALERANTLRVWALVLETGGGPSSGVEAWREARDLYRSAGVEAGVIECDAHLGREGGVGKTTFMGTVLVFGVPAAALAHGEQLLFVFGPWLLLVLSGIVSLVVWRVPWRLKLSLFAVLLASIGLLMLFPQSLAVASGTEALGTPGLAMVAAGFPILACLSAYPALKRLLSPRR
jgi:tetratricopeptide (TPR) repeat protein